MKHTWKITLTLLAMFFAAQLIGLLVVNIYSPHVLQVQVNGTTTNVTSYNLPYGMEPPQNTNPSSTLLSIIISIAIAVVFILVLMKYKVEFILRTWFFIVVIIAMGISINAFLTKIPSLAYTSLIAAIIAIPLAIFKIYKRNILVHNLTELIIYPGIAAFFVPLLTVWTVVLLLILISIYDVYAVWHAGFMQKMAKYQIQKLRLFSGFFVPYLGKKEKELINAAKLSKSKKAKGKKVKVSVAILGGGDVVFPIILVGVVLDPLGIWQALIVSIGATIALAGLFMASQKGKFYPAMPFITAGCLVALGIAYIL